MSRSTTIVIIILLALILLTICVAAVLLILRPGLGPEPTTVAPTQPPQPTQGLEATYTPTPGADATWERIQAAGKIMVGTSADYPPFEYYTQDARLAGFDIALMDEIARRLDLEVEYGDFAFEGLGDALTLGQIDAAIAAVSVTPERQAFVDFSNVYFVGQDGVLAREGSDINNISAIGDLSQFRIGAQRSTVYDDWLQNNLVATGQLPADHLLEYQRAEDAIRDLREDRLDLVMLDLQPAEAFAAEGGVKVVGQGLNQQRYAIALPKGAATLQTQINQALTALQNEGFVADLAKQYLDLDPGDIQPVPTPTPQPDATSTPAAPPPPSACLDGLAFVQHLSFDDNNRTAPPELKAGQPFNKAWRVQNTGTCTWDSSYQLVFANGNDPAAKMGGQPVAIQGQVPPGSSYDIAVDLVAPLKPGTYQATWQMVNSDGEAFGERLPLAIRVPAPPQPTPVPTQTPVPGINFNVDRTNIRAGECVVFSWNVQNVQAVYFFAEGERWQEHGVAGQARQQECPPHTTTYYLRVVKPDNSVDTREITIYVEAAPDAPQIQRFTVDPPNQIAPGQCVDIRWNVQGSVDSVRISRDNGSLWDNAPLKGQTQDCPTGTGTVSYGIEARGPGGSSQGHQNLNIVGGGTPTPPPPPPPDQPVIHAFSAQPADIPLGACIDLRWQTGGGTSWVNIFRGENMVWENAPLNGQVQDCPDTPGQVNYRLIAYNPQDKRVHQDQTVNVSQ